MKNKSLYPVFNKYILITHIYIVSLSIFTIHDWKYMCFLGFSADQYNFDDPTKGNRVYFTRDTTTLECQVLTYYSSTTQIVCDTRYIAMHLITLSV